MPAGIQGQHIVPEGTRPMGHLALLLLLADVLVVVLETWIEYFGCQLPRGSFYPVTAQCWLAWPQGQSASAWLSAPCPLVSGGYCVGYPLLLVLFKAQVIVLRVGNSG